MGGPKKGATATVKHRVHKSLTLIDLSQKPPKVAVVVKAPVPPKRKLPYTDLEMSHLSSSETIYLNQPGSYMLKGKVFTQDGFNISDTSIDEKMAHMKNLMDVITVNFAHSLGAGGMLGN